MLSKGIINRDLGTNPLNRRNTNWVLAAAGAAASLATSIFGGAQARKARKKAKREQEQRERSEQAWFDKRYNQDYMDTAAGQNLLRKANEFADKQWKKAEGAKAVGGATDAATAQAKESANKMMGDTVANISAQDTSRKDRVDEQHQQNLNNFSRERQARYEQQAQDTNAAAQNASNAIMSGAVALEQGTSNAKTNPALQGGTAEINPDGTTKYTTPSGTVVNGSARYVGAPNRTDLTGKVNESLGGIDPNDENNRSHWWDSFNGRV